MDMVIDLIVGLLYRFGVVCDWGIQLQWVCVGEIIVEMVFIVVCEDMFVELVCDEVVCGCVVILVNYYYFESELMIIGKVFVVKVNVNIGNLVVMSLIVEEVDKMVWVICWGVDIIMDLFIGKNIYEICEWILCNFFVLVGIVLIYQVLEKVKGDLIELIWEIYCDIVIEQCE